MKFYMFLIVIILFVVIFITQDSLGAPSSKTYDESFEISDSGEKYYLAEEPPNVEKNSSEEYHLAKEEPKVEKKLKIVITEEEDFVSSDSIEEYYEAPESLDFEETFNIENYDEIEDKASNKNKSSDLLSGYKDGDDWMEYAEITGEDDEYINFINHFETGELKESCDSSENYSSASSTSMETHTGHEVYN
ncbi:uncharacterized protein LOC126902539 isoform X3 [Daktulosphaira vitifoliae]|uniref:uncharacterized protein LOC126902539 isoform X3 n=1 Tax=Daktulosphaira vitifoliae TaxID=58002 RepID=UPI0021A9E15E|nr:uncharacterized protein LOC126902539 isoform X3 [Daktulosphaira vitifoliae]